MQEKVDAFNREGAKEMKLVNFVENGKVSLRENRIKSYILRRGEERVSAITQRLIVLLSEGIKQRKDKWERNIS